jgi:hypothetical protein
LKILEGYNLQKNDGFQPNDVEGAPWYHCNAYTQDHQHRQQLSCHLSHPKFHNN